MSPAVRAESQESPAKGDLEDLLFKELPAPVVSSATKIEQPIYEAPSSITLITAEDIRRMGARRLTDVFRWTPGLDVFASTGNSSAVSARGVYSRRFSRIDEMLVLIDGRSVYVDFNGGVDWESMPVFLEEIERIEIILGPSGSLYGPNAFVGTISIFTKRKPEAGMLHTTVGTNHLFENNLIQWLQGENYELRLGIGWHEDEGFGRDAGRRFLDDQNFLKMNMFGHFRLSCDDDLELRAGWLTGTQGVIRNSPSAEGEEHVDVPYGQVNFTHRFSDDASLRLQYFHNHFVFDDSNLANSTRSLETWSDVVSLEQFWRVLPSHQLIFGAEFRNFISQSPAIKPDHLEENFRSLFIEDDITLIEKQLHWIVGLRYDDFTISGDDFSPRAALVWTPVPQHSFRASIARSIATPSVEESFGFRESQAGTRNVGPPFGVVPILRVTQGNPDLDPETIVAYEVGYRGRWSKKLDVGVSLFLYDTDDLIRRVNEPEVFDPTIPAVIRPRTSDNLVDSQAYGGELNVNYRWTECLSTFLGYSHKEIPNVDNDPVAGGVSNFKNSAFAGLDYRFSCTWMLSGRIAWIDRYIVPGSGSTSFPIDDYLRLDVRLAKTILDGCGTIELIGQNLLDPRHPEGSSGVEMDRAVLLGLELRY